MNKQDWVTIPVAARMLGTGKSAVVALIESGRLTLRAIPGSWRRVRRSEVEMLAQASTVPANTS